MNELKAWRLTVEGKVSSKRSCIYYVATTEAEVKRYFEENWSRFQYLVRITDISHTKKGLDMIRSHLHFKGE